MAEYEYARISDDDYAKLNYHLRSQITTILWGLRCYGLEPYVIGAESQLLKLCENYGMAVRGKKLPIHVVFEPQERITE